MSAEYVVPDEWVERAVYAWFHHPGGGDEAMRAALAAVLPLAIAAERERCARVAEEHPELPQHGASGLTRNGQLYASKHIAAAIRGDAT